MNDVAAEEVTLAEAINLLIESRLIDVHTSFPAKVESYDATHQTVDVVPALNRSLPDGQGNWITEQLPKLNDVPVCFPRCGTFFITFPIQAGDYVWISVGQRNIGAWRATGNQGDPGDLGMHTLDGAMAIPGVFPDAKALADASGSTMKLGKDGTAAAQIEITDTQVKLGGGAQFVALANKVNDQLTAIQATFDAFAPGTGGANFPTPYTAGTVDASNVKAT